MTTTNTPTTSLTLLEAVNALLAAVGSAGVMSLATADTDEEAQKALQAIEDVAREVQQRDWHFNSEDDYALEPNTDGEIALPANVAALSVAPRSRRYDVTQRGSKLYDRGNHTFTFSEAVYVNIKFYLPFTDIPPPIRWYVTALAGRRFGVGKVPDSSTFRFTKLVEDDAHSAAQQADQQASDVTLADVSPHFQNMRRR